MESTLLKLKLISGATGDTDSLEAEIGFANGQPGGMVQTPNVKNVR